MTSLARLGTKELYEHIIESTPVAIVLIDREGLIVLVNNHAERLFGYGPKELVGQNVDILVPVRFRLAHQEHRRNYFLRPKSDSVATVKDLFGLTKDGREIPIEISLTPISTTAGLLALAAINDIRVRLDTQAIAQEHQLRTRGILDHAFQFIGVLSPEGILLDGNRTALKFAGVDESEVIGKWFWETPWWAHSEELQARLREAIRCAAGGEFVRFEATHPSRDGSLHTIDFSITPVRDPAGKVVMLIPEGRDITERKLQETYDAIQYTVTSILSEAGSLLEATSRILGAICKQLRWTCGNVFGVDRQLGVLRCLNCWHEDDPQIAAFAEATRKMLLPPGVGLAGRVWTTGQPLWKEEVRTDPEFLHRSTAIAGGIFTGLAFPIIVDGEVRGVIELFKKEPAAADPTMLRLMGNLGKQIGQFIERKQAESRLLAAKEAAEQARVALQERLNLLELGAEIALALVEKSSLADMLHHCCEAIVKHLDAVLARIWIVSETKDILELQASAGIDTHLTGSHAKIPLGKHKIGKIALERKPLLTNDVQDDLRFSDSEWVRQEGIRSFAGHPLIVAGELIGVVGMFARQPLSPATLAALSSLADTIAVGVSRKRTELKLVESELRAQAASRAKSAFLANMSHEIRTPMNGILGMTRLALQTQLTSQQREYLTMAHRSAEALLEILNDILDFSKIEAGKLTIESVPINIPELVEQAVQEMSIRVHARPLELLCSIDSTIPTALMGDPGRLRQVLLNLLSNAIKFTEQGEVEVCIVCKSATFENVEVEFSVRDTGIGITESQLTRIFEAFEQADISITRAYGGTGLGLSISARLVALMGGSLQVRSCPGHGSTFWFRVNFPRAVHPPQQRASGIPELRGMPVLIIDDNATNRRILQETLLQWNMLPQCVASALEALKAVEEANRAGRPFALILLDAMMPEMDGFRFAQYLRELPAYDAVMIMMLSSADQSSDIARCREIGIQSYLTKPVTPSVLLNAISDLFANPRINPGISRHPESSQTTAAVSLKPGLQVLLAEDNVINQKVAQGILESAGLRVTVAKNGEAAVTALKERNYDVVLMDLQMPVMDGFEATRQIREHEARTKQHTPIIALTAHAMKGDHERCIAAGMDGYIAKPLHPEELLNVISEHVASSPHRKSSSLHPDTLRTVLDRDSLIARLGGNQVVFCELLDLAPGELNRLIQELDCSILVKDLASIQLMAHSLKGSLGNLCAFPAAEAAKQLEILARERRIDSLQGAYLSLRQQVEHVLQAIDQLKHQLKSQ